MQCNICNTLQTFNLLQKWPRDNLTCSSCKSLVRERAVKYTLDRIFSELSSKKIHQSSPAGSLHSFLLKQPHYSYSYFFNDIKNGEYNKDNILCANLEILPFEDNTFDIFLTMDVFEHLFNPIIAIKEINRVVKPGGYYIMTVPIENFDKPTEKTCYKDLDNNIIHIPTKQSAFKNVTIEYHGNPIDTKGSIVTYYYGYDIVDMIHNNTNFNCEIYFKDNDINKFGIIGVYKDVFICRKPLN
jgi:SAM-dependent methyltransferase